MGVSHTVKRPSFPRPPGMSGGSGTSKRNPVLALIVGLAAAWGLINLIVASTNDSTGEINWLPVALALAAAVVGALLWRRANKDGRVLVIVSVGLALFLSGAPGAGGVTIGERARGTITNGTAFLTGGGAKFREQRARASELRDLCEKARPPAAVRKLCKK